MYSTEHLATALTLFILMDFSKHVYKRMEFPILNFKGSQVGVSRI